MRIKLFEVRDVGTRIVIAAFKTKGENTSEHRLLRCAGWGEDSIILCKINGDSECTHDPFIWGSNTLKQAHLHIQENFDKLEENSVIDVEFITGKTDKPKESEIINNLLFDF